MAHPTLESLRGAVGLWAFAHESVQPSASGEIAALAESLGYSAYWIPESTGREAMVSSTLLLQATNRIVIGTAIASIWARDAVASMNGARSLAELSSNRFVLGLGVSHQPLVENLRGHVYDKPLQAMDHYLDATHGISMRAVEREFSAPVMIAALGPGMLRLAANKTDGAIPYLVSPEHTAFARETMGPDAFLVVEQAVILGGDDDHFTRLASTHLTTYLGLPNYSNNWRRLGFGDDDFTNGGSPRLQRALIAHGDEAAIWERVDQHFSAGADHVCIQILGDDFASPPYEDWRRLSPAAAGR